MRARLAYLYQKERPKEAVMRIVRLYKGIHEGRKCMFAELENGQCGPIGYDDDGKPVVCGIRLSHEAVSQALDTYDCVPFSRLSELDEVG